MPKISGANLVRDKINSCQLTFREHNSFGKSQNIAAKCSKCKLCAIVGRPILFWEWFISTNRWMHLGEVNAAKTYCEFLRCYLQMWCFTWKRGKFPLKWSPPPPPELSACSCVLLPKNGIFPSFTPWLVGKIRWKNFISGKFGLLLFCVFCWWYLLLSTIVNHYETTINQVIQSALFIP